MHAPLGPRKGRLCFCGSSSGINGILEVLGSSEPFCGTIADDGRIEFSGKMPSLLLSFPYIAEGYVADSGIELIVTGNRYRLRITGEAAEDEEE